MNFSNHEAERKSENGGVCDMAARKGEQFETRLSNEHRGKIQNSNILNALIEHAEGNREMSRSQVSAAIALLKKVLPDLTTTTIEGGTNAVKVEFNVGGE